jgi:23S rRNA (guanine745-N1)-methyltransferase
VIDEILHLLACPHCTGPLSRRGGSVTCPEGHSFDVARQGYVSLLPGDAQLGSADTAAMVAAREAFLGAGHFEPLAEALAEEAERALAAEEAEAGARDAEAEAPGAEAGARDAEAGAPGAEAGTPGAEAGALGAGLAFGGGCVLDLGAGTGWYLARVLDRFPGRVGLALDLSKHALRRAARVHPRIGAVACDAWRGLPVRDGAAALVLSVFAPRNGPEIARVLAPGGALLVVTPTERHLGELVASLGLLTVDERKEERLAAQLDPHLELERQVQSEWSLELGPEDVANAVAMGPSAHHVPVVETPGGGMRATASVRISTYRRARG